MMKFLHAQNAGTLLKYREMTIGYVKKSGKAKTLKVQIFPYSVSAEKQ